MRELPSYCNHQSRPYKEQPRVAPSGSDLKFVKLARFVSMWSKDPSTQTGAVIVNPEGRVIGLDYNRLPAGYDIFRADEIMNNRELKYAHVIHCEKGASIAAGTERVKGCTLYTWPFMSCVTCANYMCELGIIRHVAPYNENERWVDSFEHSLRTFTAHGVEVCLLHPDPSLYLF